MFEKRIFTLLMGLVVLVLSGGVTSCKPPIPVPGNTAKPTPQAKRSVYTQDINSSPSSSSSSSSPGSASVAPQVTTSDLIKAGAVPGVSANNAKLEGKTIKLTSAGSGSFTCVKYSAKEGQCTIKYSLRTVKGTCSVMIVDSLSMHMIQISIKTQDGKTDVNQPMIMASTALTGNESSIQDSSKDSEWFFGANVCQI